MNEISHKLNRDLNLDFVKGILVLVMVLYHTMNYFSLVSQSSYVYIRFVSGAFIFISGYLVTKFYESKFNLNKWGVSKRLIIRGLKLIIIFTALNIIINLFVKENYNSVQLSIDQFVGSLFEIYIIGSDKLSSFEILLPISYLLIISPIFLAGRNFKKVIIIAIVLAGICYSLFDIYTYNSYYLIVGLFGLVLGMINIKHDFSSTGNRGFILILFLGSVYFMKFLSQNIVLYSFGISLVLKLIYDFAKKSELYSFINHIIVRLGQYSLVCYLSQIFFLQLLYRTLIREKWEFGIETVLIFLITSLLMAFICKILEFIRTKYCLINSAYKSIFA